MPVSAVSVIFTTAEGDLVHCPPFPSVGTTFMICCLRSPSEKGSKGSKPIPLIIDPVLEGRKTTLIRVTPNENVN